MGLARTEDPARACPFVVPNGHGLVKAYHPRGQELFGHVVVPRLNHLAYLPKLVEESWRGRIRVGEVALAL